MKKKKLPIRWDEKAWDNLNRIYDYIALDSVAAARYVKTELVRLAGSLNDFPEKYPKDEFLKDMPENYRFVSKWSYKIIFEVESDYIIIVAIFHTSQNPKKIRIIKDKHDS